MQRPPNLANRTYRRRKIIGIGIGEPLMPASHQRDVGSAVDLVPRGSARIAYRLDDRGLRIADVAGAELDPGDLVKLRTRQGSINVDNRNAQNNQKGLGD